MTGIQVPTQEEKDELISVLMEQNVVVEGKINGVPVNEFIHVGKAFEHLSEPQTS